MSLVTYVYSQFGRPRGVLGYVADYIMARRPSNIERNDWALSLLAVNPGDRILEVGFGPGIAAGKAAATAAEVVGIDRSALMARQAARRNREVIEKGKLKLIIGSVEELTPEIGLFDKIYSMNVVQFWREPVAVFHRLQTLLKPDGVILTAYMPRHAGAKDDDAIRKGGQIEDWLREAGFKQVRTRNRMMKPVAVVAVLASMS
jgi:cyclopropane fatty-acyl-phospholipid synthase-like methyltransferase